MTIASPPGTATAPDWKKDADEQVAVLEAHKDEWAAMPVPARLEYLEAIRRRTHDSGRRWVEAAARAKGLAPDSELVGEEWASGPWALIFGLNRYLETLREIDRQGAPRLDRRDVRTRPDGQVVVKVFPNGLMDNLLLNGIRGEVWMEPGISADSVANEMGAAYKQRPEHGAVALVLGAGNIASIAPMDVLHKLVHEHSVVLLKMHPVNDYLGPVFEDIFQPLIRDGFMAITSGGVDAGEYLVNHPGIEELHMTGSDRTHDAIVWGTGAEAAERKKQGTPLNPRRMTSELGNVTPMIVVPGPWDEQDIRFQADHIATTKLHNAGFNCIGTQVLVMPEGWDRADALVRAVREAMSDAPARKPYYPGAGDRQRQIAEGHPAAEVLDADATEAPRTLVTGLDSTDPDESCFRQECFASVLVTTSVGGNDAAEYLDRAVDFANGRLWGNLGASILVHPETMKELGPALEGAIAKLRYGTVGINIWSGVGFLLAQLPWGAYPGDSLDDIQSGIGWVHNTRFFDRPDKSVIYGPFYPYPRSMLKGQATMLPKPPWFISHRHARLANERLTSFEYDRKLSRLPGIMAAAMRG